MAISITRYVDITSSVGGSTIVPTRDLIGRIFTANSLLPPQTIIQFTSSAEVASYFGSSSEEYYRALFYFSFTSKNQVQANAIQFARWVQTATAPYVFSIKNNGSVLANWVTITSGSFVLTMGGATFTLNGLNFSSCANLSAVATVIETAVQEQTLGGELWTAATVTYSSSYQGFILQGGAPDIVSNPVAVTVGGDGTNITSQGLLGWVPEQQIINGNLIAGAIWANGSEAEAITEALQASYEASNNFGSFLFLNNLDISLSNVMLAAEWNQALNVTFMYCQAVDKNNVVTWVESLSDTGGIALTLSGLSTAQIGQITNGSSSIINLASTLSLLPGQPVSGNGITAGSVITSIVSATQVNISQPATLTATQSITFDLLQFPEQIPMIILATTDYFSSTSAVQNYEFQQFSGVSASVSDDATANAYDAISLNYYGVTQQAGQLIAFYQQGYLQGTATDIVDMGAYANEIWLRDYAQTQLLNLLLSSAQVPANISGQNLIAVTLQAVVNQALINGVISVGKTLTQAQINAITSKTKDTTAWQAVQNSGYWLNVVINQQGTPVEYIAVYTLVYSKNDVIRFIKGTHELI
jgi:hypothetical protein